MVASSHLLRPGPPGPGTSGSEGRTTRGDAGHLMLRERAVPQSEVMRAILLEGSPCCGGARTSFWSTRFWSIAYLPRPGWGRHAAIGMATERSVTTGSRTYLRAVFPMLARLEMSALVSGISLQESRPRQQRTRRPFPGAGRPPSVWRRPGTPGKAGLVLGLSCRWC